MMKMMIIAILVMSAVATAALANKPPDEVCVKVAGSGQQKTVAVTTNETTCVELFWDGVLSKDGWMSGGHYKITVQMAGEAVVVKELSETAHEGVSSERTNKMTIPAKKIPWTGTISQTTVTVFRAEQDMNGTKTPRQAPEDTASKFADPQR
ncbi:MAG: hypothetical protein WCN95_11280 [bacterium]